MLEWCSMIESTISSPGWMRSRPKVAATRLTASVALRVKMISSGRPALRKARTLARALIGFGGLVRQIMQAAMHIGVLLGVSLLDAVEHGFRLLRRGRVVEIDQRLA